MEILFEYRRIGKAFLQELFELVSSRQSIVLLGLRDLGKRYALKRLMDALRTEGAMLPIEVEFSHKPALLTPTAVRNRVAAAVSKAMPGFQFTASDLPEDELSNELLDPVKQLCQQQARPVVLLASNVDSLAHHLAQRILQETRVLVSQSNHPLTTVLTGEENLGDLVYGVNSEFNCAHQFVLQGFDEPEFIGYLRRRRELAHISCTDDEACLRLLFEHAGGNIHLARAALLAWLEMRVRTFETSDTRLETEVFETFLREFPVSDACGIDVFCQTTRVISHAPEAWQDLEALREGPPLVVAPGTKPHALELAGLAIRVDGELRYASPIMEKFARQYYDPCRLGDLHAVHGDWEAAFRFYKSMPEMHRLRPSGAADVSQLDLVCKAFVAKMHTLVTRQGVESEDKLKDLKTLFSHGCQYLLGFSEVSYWEFTVEWQPQKDQSIEVAARNLAVDILGQSNLNKIGWQETPDALAKRGSFALLPSVRPDWRDAVVVTDTRHSVAISKERARFLREMLDQFASAYDHTIANWGIKLRLAARNRHLAIATSIVTTLGESIHNPEEALTRAGDELLQKLGYRRIMFAVVDPKRQRISGVRFCCGTRPRKDVAQATDFALADWQKDIQPWVVHFKRPEVVKDWRTWNERKGADQPPMNKELCIDAETAYNFAVVPMFLRVLDASGHWIEEVFGTIHVERKDGLPPSDDDIDDLLEFGRQMAAAAHQAERVDALLKALHSDQDSVVVFDEDGLVRFANQTAANRFGIKAGWHEADANIRLKDQQLMKEMHQVLTSNRPLARHDTFLESNSRREAVFWSPLPDWRTWKPGDTLPTNSLAPLPAIGAVLQIHDLTGLHQVFAALQKVAQGAANREAAISTVLQATEELGHKLVGLFLVDPQNPDVLRSVRATGLSSVDAQEFASGHYSMERHNENRRDFWECLDTGAPQIYQWNPSSDAPRRENTDRGVTVQNLCDPAFKSPWKKTGDVWIDLPLLAPERVIGKLSIILGHDLHCDLEPEAFELLKLFSVLLGALLAALDKEPQIKATADLAMATTAHKIGTKLAGLSGFARRYREAAPSNAEVEKINAWTEPLVKDCASLVKRIRETFADMELKMESTRIRPLLEDTLKGLFANELAEGKAVWEVQCSDELTCQLDPVRFGEALEALLENSRAMTPATEQLNLKVQARLCRTGTAETLQVRVGDNGPGVPAALHDRIFQPFFSLRPDGKRSSGLGLNFVQKVMNKHGGRVFVEDKREGGAEFVLELPVYQ
jgi:signal transduction histidine kinase/PAS domain-containing protein